MLLIKPFFIREENTLPFIFREGANFRSLAN